MDALGYRNFCMACCYSRNENDKIVCRGEHSSFYGLPVKSVLNAPCIKKEPERQEGGINCDMLNLW